MDGAAQEDGQAAGLEQAGVEVEAGLLEEGGVEAMLDGVEVAGPEAAARARRERERACLIYSKFVLRKQLGYRIIHPVCSTVEWAEAVRVRGRGVCRCGATPAAKAWEGGYGYTPKLSSLPGCVVLSYTQMYRMGELLQHQKFQQIRKILIPETLSLLARARD